jgi:3-deoxy-D-manno-octulosonate 8-phosphate phosphatase (KDO 8-P phosphatase)
VFTGVRDKLTCLTALCEQLGVALSEVAYMGDDLADLSVFPHVGLAVAPANVHDWVVDKVHWVTSQHGGEGAARALHVIREARTSSGSSGRLAAP